MKFAPCEQARRHNRGLLSLAQTHTLAVLGLVIQALSMSEKPDNDLSLDLQFLPEWASDDAAVNKYADHSGEDRTSRGRRNDRRGDRKGGNRNDQRPPRRDPGSRDQRQPRGEQSDRGRKDPRRKDGPRGGRPQRPQVPQLDLKVNFVPDTQGVESIAKEIRLTGRAYPLFQIALLVLERPARYTVNLRVMKKPIG